MLTISPVSVSSTQAPTSEVAETTVEHAPAFQPQTTASFSLNGIVPHGGLHPVAHAESEVDSAVAEMQRLQQLMTLLSQILQQLQQVQTSTAGSGATTSRT